MKKLILLSIITLSSTTITAQFGPENIINQDQDVLGPNVVHHADIDNDGDEDILSASFYDDKIVWFENLGGGSFGSMNVISDMAQGARHISSADLDNDGDIDVVLASWGDDRIVWYENIGAGIFGPEEVILLNAVGLVSVYTEDIDYDGDMDILSITTSNNDILWFENLGNGSFASEQVLITTQQMFSSNDTPEAKFLDIDNDGDIDVVSMSDNLILLHENLGNLTFGPQQLILQVQTGFDIWAFQSFEINDNDNDGYIEITYCFMNVFWYYDGGIGTLEMSEDGTFNEISSLPLVNLVTNVIERDFDGDCDMDYLWTSANYLGSIQGFYYSENIGAGNYSPPELLLSSEYGSLSVFDIDLDGDEDFLLGSDDISWVEQLGSPSCPFDFNVDGEVDGDDFTIFLGNYNLPCYCCKTDLNGNGITDGADFNIFLGNYGLFCD